MTNSAKQILDVFEEVLALFAADRHDEAFALLDSVTADDVRFEDPIQVIDGKRAYMAMNRRFFGHGKHTSGTVHERFEAGDRAVLVYTLHWRARFGPTLNVPIATHLHTRDGLLVMQRDYWDLPSTLLGALPIIGPAYRRLTKLLG